MESRARTWLLALAACWISPVIMPQASRSTGMRDAKHQSKTFQGPAFEERLHLPPNDSDLAAVVE